MLDDKTKVGIIGIGKVGSTTAFSLLHRGLANHIVLLSRSLEKAKGEKLDLEHSSPLLSSAQVTATDSYQDLTDSDIIIITAGVAQKPGQTRLDVTAENKKIISQIIPRLDKHVPNAVIIVVSNPVDILTFQANQLSSRPAGHIFSTGTFLDTSRFRFHLSQSLQVHPHNIHTYILGEHGDTSFPALSSATIAGQPLSKHPAYSQEKIQQAFQDAQTAAYRIISAKGATFYAIAAVITRLVELIYRDQNSIVPVSVPIDDFYGHSDLALSVPCVIGRSGVKKTIYPQLSEKEQDQLSHSVKTLRSYL